MDTLTRLMRDTAELAPEGMDPATEGLAETAWRRGKRRQLARATATGVVTLAVLAVVASLVLGTSEAVPDQLLPAGDGNSGGVSSYPQRIGHQWIVRDLPSRPGPMAAVVAMTKGEGSTWQVVSPTGRRYHLPGAASANQDLYPVLSADGRRLAYYDGEWDRVVVRDLESAAEWFLSVGAPERTGPDGGFKTTREHELAMQHPGWFSPSNRYLALPTHDGPVVWDLHGGATWVVPTMRQPAGWLDDNRLIGRTFADGLATEATSSERTASIVMWDSRSGTTTAVGSAVDFTTMASDTTTRGQWWGTVRNDGTLWISLDEMNGETGLLGGVRLPDLSPVDLLGIPTPQQEWIEAPQAFTTVQWRGSEPLLPQTGTSGGNWWPPEGASTGRGQAVVFEDPHSVLATVWASDALSARPADTLFGTSTAWWTWWWKEIGLALAAVTGIVWWRRRRNPSEGVGAAWQSERRE
ncbi:hypothetical protein N802_00765 [Knoellia sinensis KCTC 19936]|uniref:WD40 repeat domain-containing protein n=1 Tax=Knoellia sinensis KCTC 19936 TaxID=1385520 RepID=A0A0A0JCZ5_9MICO|nr:hypothetical protein [Knoellia sinensis]KGN34993.1 hypothetical protein N802_00765 [Knoellia sinensis KCTC 19936]